MKINNYKEEEINEQNNSIEIINKNYCISNEYDQLINNLNIMKLDKNKDNIFKK